MASRLAAASGCNGPDDYFGHVRKPRRQKIAPIASSAIVARAVVMTPGAGGRSALVPASSYRRSAPTRSSSDVQ